MFTRAITRRPGPEMVGGITTANLGKPDFELALRQHAVYCRTLADLGLDVTVLDAAPGFPDACFVEDTAVVCEHVAVLTPLGAPSRQGEQLTIEPELAKHKPVVRITPPALIEGGDVLQVGKIFYVGLSERTNRAGAQALADTVAPYGYETIIIACCPSLHFKTDVNFIGNNTILVSPCCDSLPELSRFQRVIVEDDEAYARNCLYINGTVIVPEGFPKTLAKVRATGVDTVVIDVSEFRKLDGGLTCLSLRF
ncbi:arginine deiminase family protein [Pseudodesulfovibrio thermohalotolerans]|uniref:dimethylarginine dimethylaminohydrolase family protein n=1 Tax=Pseudodesulfovibrio thermohalotolerans TaxID=2880651 RepID=UPI0022BA0BAE|nr:arginine deiminase family protein [Pseudodesulfovibrio thermohalotolerans]WFS62113.1 arginine deiminase family protein [Pseudodesulfovibrio thermohalotolerans]